MGLEGVLWALGQVSHVVQKSSQETVGAEPAAPASYRRDLCIRPAEQGKEILCPGGRGSRACDGQSSASSGGAHGPDRAMTSTVTEPSEKEKSSLLPW